MRGDIIEKRYPGGELQRTLVLRLDDFASLSFFSPGPGDALEDYARIYRDFLVPACPQIFGRMLLFGMPRDDTGGQDTPDLLKAAGLLRKGLRLGKSGPVFRTEEARTLFEALDTAGLTRIASGKLPFTKIVPVGRESGLMSRRAADTAMLVNASFFILDAFDCATKYDIVGTPFGLSVRDGTILSAPLYGREALIVRRDGRVSVEVPRLEDLTLRIGDSTFSPGRSAALFTRPAYGKTPPGKGFDHVIAGSRVVDILPAGGTEVPASGFVLRTDLRVGEPGGPVHFRGMEDVVFAVQAGNSLVKNGIVTERFLSPFWNIRRPWRERPYPPSLYPLDYENARAARIALGADAQGRPLLLWAEGAAKFGHVPGKDSCGASLREFAEICLEAGMVNGVNLDGGGSAQVLLNGSRPLMISDRDPDGKEHERPVPLCLRVR